MTLLQELYGRGASLNLMDPNAIQGLGGGKSHQLPPRQQTQPPAVAPPNTSGIQVGAPVRRANEEQDLGIVKRIIGGEALIELPNGKQFVYKLEVLRPGRPSRPGDRFANVRYS